MKVLIGFIFFVLLLAGCASQPEQHRMLGTGSFDAQEASKTRISLGLTYLQNGNFSQAKFNLDKALEFTPRSADAHFAMAYYYEQVEELERAEASYKQALDFKPDDPDILNSYGAFLCKQSKYQQAKIFFLKAVNNKSYISTAETYENLALCSQSQGELQEAIRYFQSALNHQPTRAPSLFALASIQTNLGQFESAKKNLWKYERNATVTADSLFLSYQIERGLGKTKEALGYGELLKSMYPSHPLTARFREEMGKFQPVAKITSKLPSTSSVIQSEPMTTGEVNPNIDEDSTAPLEARKTTMTLEPQETAPDLQSERSVSGGSSEPNEQTSTEPAVTELSNPKIGENELIDLSVDGFHTVTPKENLYRISVRYNVKMQTLMEWNDLDDPGSIRIGMKLRVKDPD